MVKNKVEADFQSKFTPWTNVDENMEWLPACGYELKFVNLTRKKSLGLYDFRPQQIPALRRAERRGKHHKISDQSLGSKPCDGVIFKSGYVGVMYWHPKTNNLKYFYWLNVMMLLKYFESHGKKSIREEDMAKIATKIYF